MKGCGRTREQMVEFLEEKLGSREREELLDHLSRCVECAREYEKLGRLYGLMSSDNVTLPPAEIFEGVNKNLYHTVGMSGRRSRLSRLLPEILIPVLAAVALLLIVLWPRNGTVEFNIPVAELIEDEDVASLVVAGTVDRQIVEEFILLEDHLLPHYDEAIDELTPEEEEELIIALQRKYRPGT